MNKIYEGGYSPVNRAAALTVSGAGEDDPGIPKKFLRKHWFTCPPLRDIPPDKNFTDFTGYKYGSLTVIGLSAHVLRSGGSQTVRWVVKCECGIFERRRKEVIKRAEPDDACHQCRYVAHLRKQGSSSSPLLNGPEGPWEEMPALIPPDRHARSLDLIGVTYGEMTVMGRTKTVGGRKKWVVQCSCGLFQVCRTDLILTPNKALERCRICNWKLSCR